MPFDTKKDALKVVQPRKYLNKSFQALKADLLEYARTYYSDVVQDFSEASLEGLLLDFASYTGDVMSFYLDHQFSELDPETAVETQNIEKALKANGVDIVGASPATVLQSFYVEVPAATVAGKVVPDPSTLPIVQMNTVVTSDSGIDFVLMDNLDFRETNAQGQFTAEITVGETLADGTPASFILRREGLCVSGFQTEETFSLGSFVPFREITLSNENVSQIISVTDSLGNVYYEVGSLTENVVYLAVPNLSYDKDSVTDVLTLIPAPYRFIKKVDLATRSTTLVFGGGSADTLEDDIIPDPSQFAIPLFGKKTFSRTAINPQDLLTTKTLGVSGVNCTLSVHYRYGGGLNHSVPARTIRNVNTLFMSFPGNPPTNIRTAIRASADTLNLRKAEGGEDAPTADELKSLIPAMRNSQGRIVSTPDVLARIYRMPSNFGRVYRAGVRSNPDNPLSALIYVLCRDEGGRLVPASDTLKNNLKTYLNTYRMVSDAMDILDGAPVNFTFNFECMIDPTMNKNIVLRNIIKKLKELFDIKRFQIDQPLILNDVVNTIFNNLGVLSVTKIKFENVSGITNNREYSDVVWNLENNTVRGLIVPPPGGIWEMRFPDVDIVGTGI